MNPFPLGSTIKVKFPELVREILLGELTVMSKTGQSTLTAVNRSGKLLKFLDPEWFELVGENENS